MPLPDTDVDPIRPGAAPTIDIVAADLRTNNTQQPAWFRLTAAFVKWIRFHFSAASRIEFPDLIGRVWTNQPSSPIFISSLAEFAPTQGQQRPSILVDRLEQQKDMSTRGIGDQHQGVREGYFSHFLRGQHVVHCLGGREGEAELLATEVWRDLSRFAPVLREVLCLTQLLPMQIGKRIQLSQEHKEHYSVPIIIQYGYCESWALGALDEEEIAAIKTTLVGM